MKWSPRSDCRLHTEPNSPAGCDVRRSPSMTVQRGGDARIAELGGFCPRNHHVTKSAAIRVRTRTHVRSSTRRGTRDGQALSRITAARQSARHRALLHELRSVCTTWSRPTLLVRASCARGAGRLSPSRVCQGVRAAGPVSSQGTPSHCSATRGSAGLRARRPKSPPRQGGP
jgi:hypothetical protein